MNATSREVLRIDSSGVHVPEGVAVDEAARHVIAALDEHIQRLVAAEREACAELLDKMYVYPMQADMQRATLEDAAAAIRARGQQ